MTTHKRISDKLAYPSKFVEVNGAKMHYIEAGQGNPILFLHGIPMSCYSWRNIIPHLSSLGHCIAPDLMGFGKSDHPDIEYTVFDHIQYLNQFIESLNLKHITLVMHGWGSVIGFDYAMRNEKNCNGLVFYEAFLRSLNGNDVSLPYQEQLISLQEQVDIGNPVLSGASFVDRFLPQSLMRALTDEEWAHYRQPFKREGSSKPVLQYLRELPSGNGKSKVDALIAHYSQKLTKSQLPKLMLYSVPGFITTIATAMWAKENLPNLEIADLGEELHLAQESCPQLMGESISIWLQAVEQTHV